MPRARDRASSKRLASRVAADCGVARLGAASARSRGGVGRSTSGASGATPPEQGDGHMLTKPARFTDLYEAIEQMFDDLKLELVACEMCGDYHPPELHLQPFTPYDASEPEEA